MFLGGQILNFQVDNELWVTICDQSEYSFNFIESDADDIVEVDSNHSSQNEFYSVRN